MTNGTINPASRIIETVRSERGPAPDEETFRREGMTYEEAAARYLDAFLARGWRGDVVKLQRTLRNAANKGAIRRYNYFGTSVLIWPPDIDTYIDVAFRGRIIE